MTQTPSLAGVLERALADTAADGREVAAVSLTLDYGVFADPATVAVSTRVERATRSLVFVHGEALLPDGRRAATASGVFRVVSA
jgi:hypothetical protein